MVSVCFLKAQVPQKINYQAIARNSSGIPVANQNIGVKFTIRSGGISGTIVFEESHSLITNQYGLFTTQIGTGSVLTGNFLAIDWSLGPIFLEVGIDPAGGSNYLTVSNSEFVSVPYALYAKYAENGAQGISINWLGMLSSAPAIPDTLDAYFNTTNGVSFIWSGSAWDTLAKSGVAGLNGINCWDTNQNGINDPSEDINSDGNWNALDCIGATGDTGDRKSTRLNSSH